VCAKAIACSGFASVSLRSGEAEYGHSVVLAEGRFSVPAGKAKLVAFEETAQGRAYFAGHPHKTTGLLTVALLGGNKTAHPLLLP
jgi:hypothetical protein